MADGGYGATLAALEEAGRTLVMRQPYDAGPPPAVLSASPSTRAEWTAASERVNARATRSKGDLYDESESLKDSLRALEALRMDSSSKPELAKQERLIAAYERKQAAEEASAKRIAAADAAAHALAKEELAARNDKRDLELAKMASEAPRAVLEGRLRVEEAERRRADAMARLRAQEIEDEKVEVPLPAGERRP